MIWKRTGCTLTAVTPEPSSATALPKWTARRFPATRTIAALHADIPGGGFGREVIRKIMSTAVVAPRFDGYDQALIMAENAVDNELSQDRGHSNGVAAAQREINLFLSKF